ncbi:hypothetical protein BaRGS_00016079 [Batillaria attramentaria]|uniref:Uncharacterized protein n=1 Tax=Batillaria attramentaria TaxID=370345 RepID=A0ABD0KZS7_9CAEN
MVCDDKADENTGRLGKHQQTHPRLYLKVLHLSYFYLAFSLSIVPSRSLVQTTGLLWQQLTYRQPKEPSAAAFYFVEEYPCSWISMHSHHVARQFLQLDTQEW